MTALKEYQRLECTGLWKETSDSQRREVLVSFGNNSLILRDTTETALSHWSLPAIQRINEGKLPAVYKPGPDALETLEIDDKTMIEAISKVGRIIEKRKPRHGRVRTYILISIILTLGIIGFTWLPDALIQHTLSVTTQNHKVQIGESLVTEIVNLTGAPCTSTLGDRALLNFKTRVLGKIDHKLLIIPDSRKKVVSLPGKIHLIDKTVFEDYDTPEVAAGYLYNSLEKHKNNDPFQILIKEAKIGTLFTLLTTGEIKKETLRKHAEKILTTSGSQIDQENLLKRFQNARVATSPFAYALDVTGESTVTLIEGDPYKKISAPLLIQDSDWISLQTICEQ